MSEASDKVSRMLILDMFFAGVAVSLFSLAYATFEVPSNWVMKRFVRPSLWLSFLLFGWGVRGLGLTKFLDTLADLMFNLP
jgi:hypothetical protein